MYHDGLQQNIERCNDDYRCQKQPEKSFQATLLIRKFHDSLVYVPPTAGVNGIFILQEHLKNRSFHSWLGKCAVFQRLNQPASDCKNVSAIRSAISCPVKRPLSLYQTPTQLFAPNSVLAKMPVSTCRKLPF